MTDEELADAVAARRVDFILTHPYQYIELRSRFGLPNVLATLATRGPGGTPVTSLGGVILARSDREDIRSLADLRGQRIAVPTRGQTGGFLAQAYELYLAGAPLREDSDVVEVGDHDRVVEHLLAGEADVGFVRTGVIEDLMARGLLAADALKVINRQRLGAYPFASSTRLYPEWPAVALRHVDLHTVGAIIAALHELPADSPAARAAGIAGFAPPADYRPVESALEELRLPPFDHPPSYTWRDLWREHWIGISLAGAALLNVLVLYVLLLIRTGMLARQRVELRAAGERQRNTIEILQTLAELGANLTRVGASRRDAAIHGMLSTAGGLLGVDRAWLFQLDEITRRFDCTHQWRSDGAGPDSEQSRGLSVDEMRWWSGQLSAFGVVLVDEVSALTDEPDTLRQLLVAQNVRSVCALALLRGEHNPGFLAFGTVDRGYPWTREALLPYQTLATTLGNALRRWRAESDLADSQRFLYTLFESIPTPIFYKDTDGQYLGVNRGFEEFFGARREQIISKSTREVAPPELAEVYVAKDQALFESGGVQRYASQVRNAQGDLRDVVFHKAVFEDAAGRTIGLIGTVLDVTDSKRLERSLLLRNRRDEALLTLPRYVEELDEWTFMQRSQEVAEDLTESRIAFIHFVDEDAGSIELVNWSRRTLEDYCEAAFDRHYPIKSAGIWADAVRTRGPVICNDYDAYEPKQGLPEGHAALDRFLSVPVIEGNKVVMLAGVGNKPQDYDGTDVETLQLIANEIWRLLQRRRAQEQLELTASVFGHAREGIMVAEADGTILQVNDAYCDITGYTREELIGQNPRILRSGAHGAAFYRELWQTLDREGTWRGEIVNRRKDGEHTEVLLTISKVVNPDGSIRQFVALYSDITALKQYQRRLERIAHYDPLTELPNRVLVAIRIRQAMADSDRRRLRLALLYLDLDGFKEVNDTLGHDRGDEVLRVLSARMRGVLGKEQTLGRLGGDEFAVVLPRLSAEPYLPEEVQRLLDAVVQPIILDGKPYRVSASIGVTFYPQSEHADEDLLLRQADHAMYEAKQAGRSRYVVFDEQRELVKAGHRQMQEEISLGLSRDEFSFELQPKVNMRSGEVVGAECLVRWQHPHRGRLAPGEFLHHANELPLISALGEQAVRTALEQLTRWRGQGRDLTLSVNLDAQHIQQDGFVDWLAAELARYPELRPGSLVLEVLESSAMEDLSLVARVIEGCSDLGVEFSLDDFGTGYASLTYLRSLPAQEIKIDQSFVRYCLLNPDDLAILEGVLGLATAFQRRVTAEGVESIEHGELLLALGCELAQGYAIARPMHPLAFSKWAETWQPPARWRNACMLHRDELPVLFASVQYRAWIDDLERCLAVPELVPPPDEPDCRFGRWLHGDGQRLYRQMEAFDELAPLHAKAHEIGRELLALAASGRENEANARLPELHALRDQLLGALNQLLDRRPDSVPDPKALGARSRRFDA
jgi:diguanylate cyclase (GGDEF)-like protein/PAS domain S-box-containing protein